MFEFFRYETVTIPMTVKPKEKLEDYDEIVVSLKQNDIEINKTGDEVGVNIETGSINIYLTQEETALYKKGSAKIQVNIYYTDKETMNENAEIPAINKCQASDLNEIKNVINANNDMLTPVVLYNNPNNRTAGGVTLSDNANNYSYLEIYGYSTTNNCTVYEKISAPYSSFVFMIVDGSTTDNYYVNFKSITYAINDSTISYSYSREINFKKSTKAIFNYGEDQTIYITKVIGIK